jgi:hypothetical protein
MSSKTVTSAPKPPPAEVNRANQLNPEHDAYWQSRGQEGRPAEGTAPAPPPPAPQAPPKG